MWLVACMRSIARATRMARRHVQEGNLPKVLQIETTRKSALLTIATVSALALTQWFLGSESVPAAPALGTIEDAQAPPKCGQDAQHPCPKSGPQTPVQKGARARR